MLSWQCDSRRWLCNLARSWPGAQLEHESADTALGWGEEQGWLYPRWESTRKDPLLPTGCLRQPGVKLTDRQLSKIIPQIKLQSILTPRLGSLPKECCWPLWISSPGGSLGPGWLFTGQGKELSLQETMWTSAGGELGVQRPSQAKVAAEFPSTVLTTISHHSWQLCFLKVLSPSYPAQGSVVQVLKFITGLDG